MAKYIVEIEDEPFEDINAEKLWRVKGFKSLVFDKDGLDKLTPYDNAEQRGAEKAWELAKKIRLSKGSGGMTLVELGKCFGTCAIHEIFSNSYSEVAQMYEAWQKQKKNDEIKVGDEVTDNGDVGVVMEVWNDNYRILYPNGATYLMSKTRFKPTGRYFPEVADLLKKIGESNE